MLNISKENLATFNGMLNKPGFNTTAAISSFLDTESLYNYGDEGEYYNITEIPSGELTLHLTDCNKSIQLDFWFTSKSEIDNTYHKLAILEESINLLKKDLKTLIEVRKEFTKLNFNKLSKIEAIKAIDSFNKKFGTNINITIK